jgi:hypothetical protein
MTNRAMLKHCLPAGIAAIVIAGLLFGGTALAKDKKSEDKVDHPDVLLKNVSYTFDPVDEQQRWPTWPSCVVGLRDGRDNPDRRLRPLFVTGRGLEGRLSVKFADMDELEGFEGLGELASAAETSGTGSAVLDTWAGGRPDAEDFVGSDWIAAKDRPALLVKVTEILQWSATTDKRTSSGAPKTFSARISGEIRVARSRVEGEAPNQTIVYDTEKKVRFEGAKAEVAFFDLGIIKERKVSGMTVRGWPKVKGSDLGLTGSDSGDVEVYFSITGYTDFGAESVGEIDIETVSPSR